MPADPWKDTLSGAGEHGPKVRRLAFHSLPRMVVIYVLRGENAKGFLQTIHFLPLDQRGTCCDAGILLDACSAWSWPAVVADRRIVHRPTFWALGPACTFRVATTVMAVDDSLYVWLDFHVTCNHCAREKANSD